MEDKIVLHNTKCMGNYDFNNAKSYGTVCICNPFKIFKNYCRPSML